MKKPILLVLLVAWLLTVFFTVDESEYVVVTRFRNITRAVEKAGLQLKLPWPIDRVTRIDKRRRVFLGEADEFITLDGHNILVAAYIVWRVDDPKYFFRRLPQLFPGAESRLSFHLSGQLGSLLGETRLLDLVTEIPNEEVFGDGPRAPTKLQELAGQLKENLAAVGSKNYGIEVIDVRIRRLNFPDQNRETIFNRMRTAREELINRYRTDGERQAANIESAAEKEAEIIRALAREEAKVIRGQAEAEAARIFNQAIQRNPEFYDFVQRLETVRNSFKEGDTIIMPADWDLSRIIYEGVSEVK
jgi:membrane protease subunit HflC